jgi:hypothetical protein
MASKIAQTPAREDKMSIVLISCWKDNPDTRLAKEIAPVLKTHGAVSVRLAIVIQAHMLAMFLE